MWCVLCIIFFVVYQKWRVLCNLNHLLRGTILWCVFCIIFFVLYHIVMSIVYFVLSSPCIITSKYIIMWRVLCMGHSGSDLSSNVCYSIKVGSPPRTQRHGDRNLRR